MFKPTQMRPAQTQEFSCPRCGIILCVEVPKGEVGYTCVCGNHIEIRMSQAA